MEKKSEEKASLKQTIYYQTIIGVAEKTWNQLKPDLPCRI